MSDNHAARRYGTLLLLGLATMLSATLILDHVLFGPPVPGRWSLPFARARSVAAIPEPAAIYRRLPPTTRTVLTARPRAFFDSPLARKHSLDKLRDVVWNGFRLGDLDTVVIALPDQANLERAFLVVEGALDGAELRRRLREQYPSARSYSEGSIEVLEWNADPERYVGLTVGGTWRIAVVDDRTCLVSLGDRQSLTESLSPKQPAMPRDLAEALADRSAEEQLAIVMLPPFMKAMRQKMDLNPLLQAFPHLSQETYNPPSDMEASLTGCLRITGWFRTTDRVDGELQSLSERQADAEKFRGNLEYSLNLIRKAAKTQPESSSGLEAMVGEIDGFFRSLEVVSEGKKTVLRRKRLTSKD